MPHFADSITAITSDSSFTDGCHLYILLIEPKTKQFDLVHIICPSREPRVDEILPILAIHMTEPIFRMQQHIGVCALKLKSKYHEDTTSSSTNASHDAVTIQNFDLLTAIPQGSSEDYCKLIGHIIMQKNPRLVKWIRKHRKRVQKKIHSQAQDNCSSTSASSSIDEIRKLVIANSIPSQQQTNSRTLACGTLLRSNLDKIMKNKQNGNLHTNTNDHKPNFSKFNDSHNTSSILSKKRKQDEIDIPNLLRLNCDSFESSSSSESSSRPNSPDSFDSHNITYPNINTFTSSKHRNTSIFHKKSKWTSEVSYHASALVFIALITVLNIITKFFLDDRTTSLLAKDKPIDLNGVLAVIVFIFALSEIQRNWNTLQQHFFHMKYRNNRPSYRSLRSSQLGTSRKNSYIRRRRKSSIPHSIIYQTSNPNGHLFPSHFNSSPSKKLKVTKQ